MATLGIGIEPLPVAGSLDPVLYFPEQVSLVRRRSMVRRALLLLVLVVGGAAAAAADGDNAADVVAMVGK